jgi:hypothetical protein
MRHRQRFYKLEVPLSIHTLPLRRFYNHELKVRIFNTTFAGPVVHHYSESSRPYSWIHVNNISLVDPFMVLLSSLPPEYVLIGIGGANEAVIRMLISIGK